MLIEVAITKSPNNISVMQASQTFTEQGGTIGRGPSNTWVLDDPNRYMSTKHAEIRYEGGNYYLVDLSTNGTFVSLNGALNPIGNGNRVILKDGDLFSLSDYEFRVTLRQNDAGSIPLGDPFDAGPFVSNNTASFPSDPFASPHSMPLDDPFGAQSPIIDTNFGLGNQTVDPLELLDKPSRFGDSGSQANIFLRGSEPDNADPLNQALAWPNAIQDKGAIPDDWYEDKSSAAPPVQKKPSTGDSDMQRRLQRAEHSNFALEKENHRLLADIALLTQQLKNQQTTSAPKAARRDVSAQDRLLIEAMGLSKWNLSDQKITEISQIAGELVRETMIGLTQVLGFRKKIKEEFRINVTTIKPVENNPLKFSANVEDALENMFIKENKAYQKPVEAVREGFSGIAEHQVAVLAGIQAAFRGMIERFDPDALESRFEKYRKAGIIKVNQKGKNWDAYREFHKDLVNNIDNSFQHLFGYAFVTAYEEQLQKLQMSRKANFSGKND
jgi:type VI secretion system FHA domain protein